MNVIIAATDYSRDGDNAVRYAAGLANQMKAKLILFNVFVMPVHAANTLLSAAAVASMVESNKVRLEKFAVETGKEYQINTSAEVAYGDFNEEIGTMYRTQKATLVVLGMKGGSIEQSLLGNTTTGLIKTADYPVLSVPQTTSFRQIKKVLFACDYSCSYQMRTLESLKAIFEKLQSDVEVFNVEKDSAEDNKHVVPELLHLAAEGLLTQKTVRGIQVIKSIRTEVKEIGADLLVMVPQKYKFWESIIHVSRTGIMASQSDVPLLSVPNRA